MKSYFVGRGLGERGCWMGGSGVWSGDWTGKDGREEQEGLEGPLFEGLDQASFDLSGTCDETVEIITNIKATGANEYTVDIFSS